MVRLVYGLLWVCGCVGGRHVLCGSDTSDYSEPGVPAYRVYDLRDLGTGFRTASFARDRLGRLLLLSGGNLWTFDGGEWMPLIESNEAIVFSGIDVDRHGRIYLGGSSEWGYLEKNRGQGYVYRSLKMGTSANHQLSSGDYFDVKILGDRVGFMGENSFVLLEPDGTSRVYDGFYHLTTQFFLGDEVYVATEAEGLFRITQGEVVPVELDWEGITPGGKPGVITAACVSNTRGGVIMAVSGVGLVLYDGTDMVRMEKHLEALETYRILKVICFEDGSIALSIDEWGLAIVDAHGRPLRTISKEADRQFIRVRNLHDNGDGTLWVTVANGIAKIIYPSALSFYGYQQNLPLYWPSAYRYKGKLMVQTNRTVFLGVYNNERQLSHFESHFQLKDHPLMDTAYPVDGEGIFLSDDRKLFLQPEVGELYEIADDLPVRYFHQHPDRSDVIFLLNHEGVYTIRKVEDRWVYRGDFLEAKGIFNQVHVRDVSGTFWSERGPGKLVRYWIGEDDKLQGRVYDSREGLGDLWINLYRVGTEVCASFGNKQVHYDAEQDRFVLDALMEKLQAHIGKNITRPFEYESHKLIVTTSHGVVLVDITDPARPQYDFQTFASFPEFNPLVMNDIEGQIWLRTESSLIRFEPDLLQQERDDRSAEVLIERVSVPGSESPLYSIDDATTDYSNQKVIFDYHRSGLQFHFYSTINNQLYPVRYRYYLEGMSETWSELSSRTTAIFVGILEGDYTLLVEPVDHFGRSGHVARFSFTVKPPWYREQLAYVAYLFLFLIVMLLIILRIRDSAKRDNQRLEKLVAMKTEEYEKAALTAMEASKAKSQFLANMSHEIRTPINGIIGTGELLESSELSREQQDLLKIVKSSAISLMEVIEDILSFSKIEAGRVELREEDFELEELILECLRVVSDRSMKKRIDVFYGMHATDHILFKGDKGRIKQVIINLLENALKFTNEGHVQVDCSSEVLPDPGFRELRITIEDTGIGIEKEKLQHLFDPFFQIDNSNTRSYQGTGLGLSICKGLVEKMGGIIVIESLKGLGTQVHVKIPLKVSESMKTGSLEPEPNLPNPLCWVDQNCRKGESIALLMGKKGTAVQWIAGAQAALQHLQRAGAVWPDYFIVEQEDSRAFAELTNLLLQAYAQGMIAGFTILSYPDIHFSKELTPHVLYKPWSFSVLQQHLLGISSHNSEAVWRGRGELSKPSRQLALDRLKSKRVLIVEDNKVNYKVLDLILRKSGIESDHAWNGKEACEMDARTFYDLILMDVQMPEMDGLEATARIKTSHPQSYVIGISASARETDRKTALMSKMDDYLTKPVRREDLAQAVARFLDTKTR